MAVDRHVYNIFWKDLLSGDFDIDDKKYKAILLDPEYVFNNTHENYSDVALYEIANKRSYMKGGIVAKLSLGVDKYGRQVVNCEPITWSSIDAKFKYFTVYERESGNLVCTLDLGINTSNGNRVDLSFPGGLLAIKNTDDAEHIHHKINIYKTRKVDEIPIVPDEDTIYYSGKGPGFFFEN